MKEILLAKKKKLPDTGFTHSLNQVHDGQFKQLIMPSLQYQQATRAPSGAAASKQSAYIQNTFSQEACQELMKDTQSKEELQRRFKILSKEASLLRAKA